MLAIYDDTTYYNIKDTTKFEHFVQIIDNNNGIDYSKSTIIDKTEERQLYLVQHFMKHKYERYDD